MSECQTKAENQETHKKTTKTVGLTKKKCIFFPGNAEESVDGQTVSVIEDEYVYNSGEEGVTESAKGAQRPDPESHLRHTTREQCLTKLQSGRNWSRLLQFQCYSTVQLRIRELPSC